MDSYLTTQRSTIFQQVGVMIYVFDVETREMGKDLEYYRDCMMGLKQFSPDAAVFLLVHKMDLVRKPSQPTFERKKQELQEASGDTNICVFGTSIYDETLYKVRPRDSIVYIFLTVHIKGLVKYSAYFDPERSHSVQALVNICRSL